jgi:hypothetical protein
MRLDNLWTILHWASIDLQNRKKNWLRENLGFKNRDMQLTLLIF